LWSIEDSKYIYGIGRDDLYFLDVDARGRLCLRLENGSVPIPELVEKVRSVSQAESSSFTVRIPALAAERATKLATAFREAIRLSKYDGKYQPVYPIKVNHHYDIVRAILATDPLYGLEAGSKGEFLLIRSIVGQERSRLLICNGIKDTEYLKMAKDVQSVGQNVLVTIESASEAELVARSFPDGGMPIGLRVKPYVETSGHWRAAGGRSSKFGMAPRDLVQAMEVLRTNNLKKDVVSVHAHIGSQIADLGSVRDLARFMTEMYAWLISRQNLTGLRLIDLGGGLPVNYEGVRKDIAADQYARIIVESVSAACTELGISRPPTIMTETGRAVVAHSSMVLVRILGQRGSSPDGGAITIEVAEEARKWARLVKNAKSLASVLRVWARLNKETEGPTGDVDRLHHREQLLTMVKDSIRKKMIDDGLKDADGTVPDSILFPDVIAFGNFSVFNSCIDHLVVGQYFPVIPAVGLDKQPETTVRIADITADSDGEISAFVRREQPEERELATADGRPLTGPKNEIAVGIPIPSVKTLKGSFFVIALTGAYQEVMASDPSLLGRLPDVVVAFKSGQLNVACKRGDASLASKLSQYGLETGSFEPYSSGDEEQ